MAVRHAPSMKRLTFEYMGDLVARFVMPAQKHPAASRSGRDGPGHDDVDGPPENSSGLSEPWPAPQCHDRMHARQRCMCGNVVLSEAAPRPQRGVRPFSYDLDPIPTAHKPDF